MQDPAPLGKLNLVIGPWIGVASLLVTVTLALLITRVATVALRTTGLSHDVARFQARSAFSGTGFTTSESEDIVNHPARRNIVLSLMLLSSAGLVTTIASLLLSFARTSGYRQPASRAAVLVVGLFVLWRLAASPAVDRFLSRIIERVLARWTDLDVRDYVRLLQISGDYTITEVTIDDGDWVEDRSLRDLGLDREGVVVLGIRRCGGSYVGAPKGATTIHAGDVIVLYGRANVVSELGDRPAGAVGDRAHDAAVAEHDRITSAEAAAQEEAAAKEPVAER